MIQNGDFRRFMRMVAGHTINCFCFYVYMRNVRVRAGLLSPLNSSRATRRQILQEERTQKQFQYFKTITNIIMLKNSMLF